MSIVFVGIGSNQNNPKNQVRWAIENIHHLPTTEVIQASSLYITKPVGDVEQEDFINAVVKIQTRLEPEVLLKQLLSLEHLRGRKRLQKWGPRTLDLDILLYDNLCLNLSQLMIPHPEMTKRRFVLQPLAEIEPNGCLPCGTPITKFLEKVMSDPLQEISPLNIIFQE